MLGFYSYYGSSGISVFGFTAASAYVAAGLSCWDTVAAIFLGACIAAISSFFGSRPGVDMSLGYTMMTRVTFGLWGAFLSLTIVLIANTVFVSLPLSIMGVLDSWNTAIWLPLLMIGVYCGRLASLRFMVGRPLLSFLEL